MACRIMIVIGLMLASAVAVEPEQNRDDASLIQLNALTQDPPCNSNDREKMDKLAKDNVEANMEKIKKNQDAAKNMLAMLQIGQNFSEGQMPSQMMSQVPTACMPKILFSSTGAINSRVALARCYRAQGADALQAKCMVEDSVWREEHCTSSCRKGNPANPLAWKQSQSEFAQNAASCMRCAGDHAETLGRCMTPECDYSLTHDETGKMKSKAAMMTCFMKMSGKPKAAQCLLDNEMWIEENCQKQCGRLQDGHSWRKLSDEQLTQMNKECGICKADNLENVNVCTYKTNDISATCASCQTKALVFSIKNCQASGVCDGKTPDACTACQQSAFEKNKACAPGWHPEQDKFSPERLAAKAKADAKEAAEKGDN